MNNFHKVFLSFIVLLAFGQSHAQENDVASYPLKSIRKYCLDKPDILVEEVSFLYDSEKRLKKEYKIHIMQDTTYKSYVLYNFNDKNLLISKELYSDTSELDRIKVFKYDKNNRLIYEAYDLGIKGKYMESAYTYDNNGKLTTSTYKINYHKYLYNYNYDSLGNKIKTYENGYLKYSYEYENKKLIKEIIHRSTRNPNKKEYQLITKYSYNSKEQLIQIQKENKILKRFEYDNSRLTTKWTYNEFDLLPCRNTCCNNYIFKYDYYE